MKKLIKDGDWGQIDSNQLCRVIDFTPNSDGFSHYATIKFECNSYPNGVIGYIYHKTDFNNLLAAIKGQASNPNTEVVFFWSNKRYKNFIYNFLSAFMPKFWIMLCPINSYELHTKNEYRPEISGEARYMATIPVQEWKPNVMK